MVTLAEDTEAVAQQLARFMSEAGLGIGAAMAEEMGGLEGLAEQEGAPPASRDARDALRLPFLRLDSCPNNRCLSRFVKSGVVG